MIATWVRMLVHSIAWIRWKINDEGDANIDARQPGLVMYWRAISQFYAGDQNSGVPESSIDARCRRERLAVAQMGKPLRALAHQRIIFERGERDAFGIASALQFIARLLSHHHGFALFCEAPAHQADAVRP